LSATTTAAELAQLVAQLAQFAQALSDQVERPAPKPNARELPKRVLLTVEEAAQMLNIGRTSMFKLIRDRQVETVQIGTLRRVAVSAVEDYAARLVAESSAPAA